MNENIKKYTSVIDLFCGVGGLTHGFIKEEFNVVAGFDIDETCRYAYEVNNKTTFVCKDVSILTKEEIQMYYKDAQIRVLVGCAPCQPFSTYSHKNNDTQKWQLLNHFSRIIKEVQPEIVSMENVPGIEKFNKATVFSDFLEMLKIEGYECSYETVNCAEYGVPQQRKRLVLLASKLGTIKLIPSTHKKDTGYLTVADVIKDMPPLKSGETYLIDPLHRATKLSELNLKRIRQSVPKGTWRDWDKDLQLKCHQKNSGKSYVSVYGRMSWDEPAPTITTHCIGIGNGRFGHPEQDRSITLREAAMLQTFPIYYQFIKKGERYNARTISTHIGNAVPVQLGQIIAQSIYNHIKTHIHVKEK